MVQARAGGHGGDAQGTRAVIATNWWARWLEHSI